MTKLSKHLPANERRAVTIAAVIDLAAEQNPSNITTAAIAQHMGLTQGALFRHFPSKEAILQGVMEWVADKLINRIDKAALSVADSPVAALEAIFMAHIDFVAKHPGVPRIMFGELQRAGETAPKRVVKVLLQRYSERLHRLIDDGKQQGKLASTLDTEAAVILFIGTIQGLVMRSMLVTSCIRDDAPRVFAIYKQGILSS